MRNEISRLISIRASPILGFGGWGGGELDLSSFFRDKSITGNSIFLGSGRKNIGLEGGGGGEGASVATLTKRNFRSRCALNRILLVHYANEYKID